MSTSIETHQTKSLFQRLKPFLLVGLVGVALYVVVYVLLGTGGGATSQPTPSSGGSGASSGTPTSSSSPGSEETTTSQPSSLIEDGSQGGFPSWVKIVGGTVLAIAALFIGSAALSVLWEQYQSRREEEDQVSRKERRAQELRDMRERFDNLIKQDKEATRKLTRDDKLFLRNFRESYDRLKENVGLPDYNDWEERYYQHNLNGLERNWFSLIRDLFTETPEERGHTRDSVLMGMPSNLK